MLTRIRLKNLKNRLIVSGLGDSCRGKENKGCPSCSFLADHFDGSTLHLANRDVTLAVISRAPIAEIEAFKKRMGCRFGWVSSFANDFNYDYHVSFTKDEMATGKVYYNYGMREFQSEEAPGASVFYKDSTGAIFHTIRVMRAALISCSARTIFSTSPLRAVTKAPWPLRWLGFATAKVISSIRRNPTHPLTAQAPRAVPERATRTVEVARGRYDRAHFWNFFAGWMEF